MSLQAFIDRASSISVVAGARTIKASYLSTNKLIDDANPLGINSTVAISNHFKSPPIRLTTDDVNTYLASSVVLHSLDGWVYLSHAIESLLKGDEGIAIHLAYYAELRASMAFLSAEGVGIFDHTHIGLDAASNIASNPDVYKVLPSGRRTKVNSGTHQFVWDCIEKWGSSSVKPSNTDLLKVFSVNGKTFEDWASAFPFSAVINGSIIIQRWLRDWNFDVSYFKDDRSIRNQVSYRPQRLKDIPQVYSLNQIIDKLYSFWEIMEPDQTNRFQIIDKYLLRFFVQQLYNSLSTSIKASTFVRKCD
jgi:hypothetical protein